MEGLLVRRWLPALGALVLVVALLPLFGGVAAATNDKPDKQDKQDTAASEVATSDRDAKTNNGNAYGHDKQQADDSAGQSVTAASSAGSQASTGEQASNERASSSAKSDAKAAKHADKPTASNGADKSAKGNGADKSAKGNGADKSAKGNNGNGEDKGAKGNGNAGKGQGEGHTPVNICHATGSDSNPYVFITVDDDSVKLRGHLEHRNDPNKTWKSAGTYTLGGAHQAGDPKPDYIGDYVDSDGVTHVLDGPIDGPEDCPRPTTPPPPPPNLNQPSGSFSVSCPTTTTVPEADINALTVGDFSGGALFLVATTGGFEVQVSSEQQNVAVPANTTLQLQYRRTGDATRILDTKTSPSTCPGGGGGGNELDKKSNPADGSTVPPGTAIAYTVTVRNTGQVTLTDRPVVDTLPTFVTVVPGTVSGGGVVSANGRTITWTVSLAPGETRSFTYVGLVNANTPPGTILINEVTFEDQKDSTSHPVGPGETEVGGVKEGNQGGSGNGPGNGPGAAPQAPTSPDTAVLGTKTGLLPHTGLGALVWILALAGLVLLTIGIVARMAGRRPGVTE